MCITKQICCPGGLGKHLVFMTSICSLYLNVLRCGNHVPQAVSLIENVRLQNEEEEILWRENLMKLYLNLSLCCLKQAKSSRAITYGRKVLDLEPNNAKANYRLGQVNNT